MLDNLKVFDIFFESKCNSECNERILIVATEKQTIEEIIPFYENFFGTNTSKGKRYERKISYCSRDIIHGWDGKDYKIILELNNN